LGRPGSADMFTGIVQGIAEVAHIADRNGLRSLRLSFPSGFDRGLHLGASVAVEGVCLTVTALHADAADLDVMQQTLSLTTLGALKQGSAVNVERAAKEGAEVGGHVLSGHIDFKATIARPRTTARCALPCRRRGCAMSSPRATSRSTARA
jgi:riboflavin synthase